MKNIFYDNANKITIFTKADTLIQLQGKLNNAIVLPAMKFTLSEWRGDCEKCWSEVHDRFSRKKLIIRSSCLDEDRNDKSNAGKYLSVPDVMSRESFFDAVERIFDSYTDDGRNENPEDQILVQPMLESVFICGVAFTMDPNNGGNYDVINYDTTGSTDNITSGSGEADRLFYHYKYADDIDNSDSIIDNIFSPLIQTLRELESLFGKNNLDVEFAFDKNDRLYILQVRELCIGGVDNISREAQSLSLNGIYKKVEAEQQKKPFLCGERAIYSVMTDWNPAEMIGVYPRPLALSLYREIITDSVWAYQRDNYGYRNLRSFPLLVEFAGIPYIDVRVSFNSFVPAMLDEDLSEKLVNYYLDRLSKRPEEHDKAEFNIVFSCYTFDLPERIKVLKENGFTDEEIGSILDALRNVTNQIIDHENGLWRKDYGKIEKLKTRYDEIVNSEMPAIDKVYWLLEDCKRYGTLPFAGLARAAFVAVQILKSMVSVGILTEVDYDKFMNGVDSVSSQMNRDFRTLNKSEFIRKYGHLRPGTYDITSPRYDAAPDMYFDWNKEREEAAEETEEFRLSMEQMHLLREKLRECGLNNDILELLDFIKKVIEGREYGKFIFTRNLSKALELIAEIGKKYDLDRDDLSYMDIHSIYKLYSSSSDPGTEIPVAIGRGREEYKLKSSLLLPPVIVSPQDVLSFHYPDAEPNYITSGRAAGEVISISDVNKDGILEGKILLIPGADPGYDWIFSRGISGFITKYGGANSHMAIRAGELGIPAVIGVGEKLFQKCLDAEAVEIDSAAKKIAIIK